MICGKIRKGNSNYATSKELAFSKQLDLRRKPKYQNNKKRQVVKLTGAHAPLRKGMIL